MDVKCDRCRRDFPPQEALVFTLVNNRDYRFVCKDCAIQYLEDEGKPEDLELLELTLTTEVLEEVRRRGLSELADKAEQTMLERGWLPPDTLEPE